MSASKDSKDLDAGIFETPIPTARTHDIQGSVGLRSRPWWKFGGQDQSFIPSHLESDSSTSGSLKEDLETNAYNTKGESVFDDTRAADFYKPIEKYEGRHRFDPSATWSDDEERRLVRRVSLN